LPEDVVSSSLTLKTPQNEGVSISAKIESVYLNRPFFLQFG
jgi:hypothetical protein